MFDFTKLLGNAEGIDDDGIERGSVVFWFGSNPDFLDGFDDGSLEVELLDSFGYIGLVSEGIDHEDISTGPTERRKEADAKVSGDFDGMRDETKNSRSDLFQHRGRSHLTNLGSGSLDAGERGLEIS